VVSVLGGCAGSASPVVSAAPAGAADWQLVEDDKGIKVWSLAIPGQDLPGFRGITTVQASVDDVMNFVLDVKRHTEWQYNCDESQLVKRYDEEHGILYNRINAPWPVYDRDVLLDIAYRYTPQRTAVTFRFRNTQEFGKPIPRRVVRIPRLEGFFRIWQETPTKTNVLYQVEVDIGGDVPDRQARRYARNLPFKTLEKLRALIEEKNKPS
jgi:hypothetical protein